MLIRAYSLQNFEAIAAANEALFGAVQPDLVELSRYKLAQTKPTQDNLF
ncbi:MAG: hypothetical protein H6765_07885 [Candidatus Peribacteria bacterium]|nr:MAG: hypothetical protein H6765_07885 [Candidatus Peribacteria bacterium]